MKDIVIVFARAPRLGAVKRRLAGDIGQRAALRFHMQTLTRLLSALSREGRFQTVLAVTPDHVRFRLPLLPSRCVPHLSPALSAPDGGEGAGTVPLRPPVGRRGWARWGLTTRIPQGRGHLGQRMERAFRRFPHTRVALVGSDIPSMTVADLRAAFRALGRSNAVFGPAEDGGYWLIGMSPRRPARPFARVRWSSEHALADTLLNFTGRRVALLRTLRDVDTAADFRWKAS